MNDYGLSQQFGKYGRTKKGLTMYGMLRDLFERTWCKETASPDCQAAWTPQNPAYGQSSVTALAVQVLCGGTLVHAVVGDRPHYFNHLPNGEGYAVYDLTRTQFPPGTTVDPGSIIERPYVLESPSAVGDGTKERYELLRSRLADAMRTG